MQENNSITAIRGVRVGHATVADKLTGCTLVRFDKPMVVAYKGFGGSIGSFNTQSVTAGSTSYKENGIFISGGSNTGLMVGGAYLDLLRQDSWGAFNGKVYNPSVVGAIVYDLGMSVEPIDISMTKTAYESLTDEQVKSGNVGAGTGTTVGSFHWLEQGNKNGSMKSGVGNARIDLGNGIIVTAMTVLNALGNVYQKDGAILAGNRDEGKKFRSYQDLQNFVSKDSGNTTISVVGINVDLRSKEHYERIAQMANHGLVRSILPVNTNSDGDSIFVFSNEEIKKPLNELSKYFLQTDDDIHFIVDIIGQAAADAVQESVYDACLSAESIHIDSAYQGIIPSPKDYS